MKLDDPGITLLGVHGLKIVFIQPKVGFKGHTWEALGIGYLVSYLQSHFPNDLEFDFFSGFFDTDEDIIKGCKDADIIGFGCTSPQYKHAIQLAGQIATPKNTIVFGGIHSTVLPRHVWASGVVNTVVAGEGEPCMREIVSAKIQGKKVTPLFTASGPITDLDSLPFPNREVIKQRRNLAQVEREEDRRVASILSSRGCPFSCKFCSSNALWGSKTRFRSSSDILNEMEYLVDHMSVNFIKFADDTFTLSRLLTKKFCEEKNSRDDWVKELPYGCNTHVEAFDEVLAFELSRSGCEEVWFGVESGSPRILAEMNKKITPEQVIKAFTLAKAYGLKTRAYFLLGTPGETGEDISLTEKLCRIIEPDMVGFTLLAPFPGSGYYDPDLMLSWDWSNFDEYGNPWIDPMYREAQKRLVATFQDKAVYRQRVKNG